METYRNEHSGDFEILPEVSGNDVERNYLRQTMKADCEIITGNIDKATLTTKIPDQHP